MVEKFNLMILGDVATGKTSLMQRYATGTFRAEMSTATVGIGYLFKNIEVDGISVLVQVWDTAGQERFDSISLPFFRSANGMLIVFDLTVRETFEHLQHWVTLTREFQENIPLVLIGTKLDLASRRVVSRAEAELFSQEKNMQYFELSAQTGEGVERAFAAFLPPMIRGLRKRPPVRQSNQSLNATKADVGKDGCC
eukprot:m.15067 g.15067  ORF g.15067 m.15067 type:complete len:196 (-) comp6590_c0_seq2:300-887(-)